MYTLPSVDNGFVGRLLGTGMSATHNSQKNVDVFGEKKVKYNDFQIFKYKDSVLRN